MKVISKKRKNIEGNFRVLVWTTSWVVVLFTETETIGEKASLGEKKQELSLRH